MVPSVISTIGKIFEIRFGDNLSEQLSPAKSYGAVGRINIKFGNRSGHGTGTLISKNIVLTCGHNLFDRENNQLATEV